MIKHIEKLSTYQKQVFLKQAQSIIAGWDEPANPSVVWNGWCHEIHFNNEDESYMVGWKCECGNLILDYDDYSGRDIDTDRCPKCGKHYDYTEEELANL